MITIWFHFLLCIQCSLSHRCPYIHSSDLLFSAAPYSKHKAVDALRAQCRLRRLSGKPGLGLHTVYQHPPVSPFTDLQVNPSSPHTFQSYFRARCMPVWPCGFLGSLYSVCRACWYAGWEVRAFCCFFLSLVKAKSVTACYWWSVDLWLL